MEFLTPQQVLHAYTMGIFPMANPEEGNAVYWYEPQERGIIPLNGLKISKSLKATLKKQKFDVRMNTAFREVMEACAERSETWISEEIINVYCELHESGWAHSVECWDEDGLVGGLYGVSIRKAFFGESMFHKKTDASKVALAYLVHWMNENEFKLLDTQYLTDHLASLGGIAISQEEYKILLADALRD